MVLGWLGEAAEPLQALSRAFLCDVHIRQLQRDKLYAVLRAGKDDERGEAEAIQRLECSPHTVVYSMSCLCSKPPMNLVDIQQGEQSAFPGALRGYHYPQDTHVCPCRLFLWPISTKLGQKTYFSLVRK